MADPISYHNVLIDDVPYCPEVAVDNRVQRKVESDLIDRIVEELKYRKKDAGDSAVACLAEGLPISAADAEGCYRGFIDSIEAVELFRPDKEETEG